GAREFRLSAHRNQPAVAGAHDRRPGGRRDTHDAGPAARGCALRSWCPRSHPHPPSSIRHASCAMARMNRVEPLQQLAALCRDGRPAPRSRAVEPTGTAELDRALPGGGWQAGTIVELMPLATGIGELRLLMPALARITQSGRHVALVAPPYIPYAPALSWHGIRLERLLVI